MLKTFPTGLANCLIGLFFYFFLNLFVLVWAGIELIFFLIAGVDPIYWDSWSQRTTGFFHTTWHHAQHIHLGGSWQKCYCLGIGLAVDWGWAIIFICMICLYFHLFLIFLSITSYYYYYYFRFNLMSFNSNDIVITYHCHYLSLFNSNSNYTDIISNNKFSHFYPSKSLPPFYWGRSEQIALMGSVALVD